MVKIDDIHMGDVGAVVEDVQHRLMKVGYLSETEQSGVFDEKTSHALQNFCLDRGIVSEQRLNSRIWSALVDASFHFGDRTLYLRMPHFHGADVGILQNALNILGFTCGDADGIFGAYTEQAVRKFQLNMGLPSDGIVGAYTFTALRHLRHNWEGKEGLHSLAYRGFSRASEVLEKNALCFFGIDPFTRLVAARISNLAMATNPASKLTSAESLLVEPSDSMMLVQILLDEEPLAGVPCVDYAEDEGMLTRLRAALSAAYCLHPARLALRLPGKVWSQAGESRSAQHYAITLLDAFCTVLPH